MCQLALQTVDVALCPINGGFERGHAVLVFVGSGLFACPFDWRALLVLLHQTLVLFLQAQLPVR